MKNNINLSILALSITLFSQTVGKNLTSDLLQLEISLENLSTLLKTDAEWVSPVLQNIHSAISELLGLINLDSVENFNAQYNYHSFLKPKVRELKNLHEKMTQEEQMQLRIEIFNFFNKIIAELPVAEGEFHRKNRNTEKTIKFAAILGLIWLLIEELWLQLSGYIDCAYELLTKKVYDTLKYVSTDPIIQMWQIKKRLDHGYYIGLKHALKILDQVPPWPTIAIMKEHDSALNSAQLTLEMIEEMLTSPQLPLLDQYETIRKNIKTWVEEIDLSLNEKLFQRYPLQLAEEPSLAQAKSAYEQAKKESAVPLEFKYKNNKISREKAYSILGLSPSSSLTAQDIYDALIIKTRHMDQTSIEFIELDRLATLLMKDAERESKLLKLKGSIINEQMDNIEAQKMLPKLKAQFEELQKQIDTIRANLGN